MSESVVFVGKFLIFMGVIFDLFGTVGLVRLPDVYNRLQASTKCVTLGTCFILFGSFLVVGLPLLKSLLVIAFVVMSSPAAAHAIARSAHRAKIPLWEKSVVDKYREDRESEKA